MSRLKVTGPNGTEAGEGWEKSDWLQPEISNATAGPSRTHGIREPIPKELRPNAQGCEARATLGKRLPQSLADCRQPRYS
ncbi:MAG: hypothetical protein ABI651_11820 [Verrucomicrobiota bacterium]